MKITNLKYLLIFLLFCCSQLYAISFQEYKKQQQLGYNKYKTNLENEFKAYKKAYADAFRDFKKDLKLHWKNPKITTKYTFVEYSKDLKDRKIVDYKNQNITFEVIANNQKEAQKRFSKMFNNLMKEDVEQAYSKDIIEQKVKKKLHKSKLNHISNQKIIADMIEEQEKRKLKRQITPSNFKVIKYNKNNIYKITMQLPPKSFLKKAKIYHKRVKLNAREQKIPTELIYAIIHSESSFNPMARSYVPAFGLMQIVPKTAGRDTYKYLYNKDKLLTSNYLYNSKNNIKIGSGYLHILYYRYLKNIKNPTSRLYCTIAAYNTGAGNVARVFIGNTNIYKASKVINNLTSNEVYNKLLRDLPHNETKHYLKKVYKRVVMYDRLLKNNF